MGLSLSRGLCIGGTIWFACALPLVDDHEGLRIAVSGIIAFAFGWTMFDKEIRKANEN